MTETNHGLNVVRRRFDFVSNRIALIINLHEAQWKPIKCTIIWNVTPWSPAKFADVQDLENSQVRRLHEAGGKQSQSVFLNKYQMITIYAHGT
jgi:hypothetical protein